MYIIMYHYVRNLEHSRYPRIKALDLNLFQQQVAFLQSRFSFISVEELQEAITGGAGVPKNTALLTFDDGYIDHYTNVFPVLRNRGIPAFFSMPGKIIAEGKLLDVNKIHFVLASSDIETIKARMMSRLDFYRGSEFDIPDHLELYRQYGVVNRFDDADTIFVKRILQTGLVERLRNLLVSELFREFVFDSEEIFAKELYMSFDQVRLMKNAGMCFGLHGYDHNWLGSLPEEAMKLDIDRALDVFDSILPANNWVMCYPFGSYNQNVINYVQSKGCGLGFSTEVAAANLKTDNHLALPRFDTNDFPPKSEMYEEIA